MYGGGAGLTRLFSLEDDYLGKGCNEPIKCGDGVRICRV
jgi:hypothetical protein